MRARELNQNWTMRCVEDSQWQEARVPGTVYTDLLRNGNMEDPYWKDNEDAICSLMEKDYEYQCTFQGEETEDLSNAFLRFEGLDTVADIYLNNVHVGNAESMHRTWEYPVKEVLSPGENTLKVVFHSPLKFIAQAYKKYGNIGNDDTYEGFMHLRKAHYMFGWDWGAHLPDAGIFRPVFLCSVSHGRIDSVYIRQCHEENKCTLKFEGDCIRETPGEYQWRVLVTAPDGQKYETALSAEGEGQLVIEDPELWWPNGLGDQPLYQVEAQLLYEGNVEDTWKKRIGLRTMTMQRKKDQYGESFAHEVNGKAFFAMGADYIPEEHLLGRRSEEKTRKLLEDCKLANFNVIRVWGGGFYPDDWFFDICDELGLVVWQDFMFACSVYELTPEFEANIRKEFADNIKRLRHHASLGLWCGNNEIDAAWRGWGWKREYTQQQQERIFKAYTDVFHRLLPEVIEKYTDGDDYWPSSPMSGPEIGDHEIRPANRGDNHYWGVWHEKHKFEEYEKNIGRFISEHGFQSFPEFETVRQYTLPEDYDIESEIMSAHQRSGIGNLRIREYMGWYYQVPEDFGQMLYMSQVLQARAMRIAMETHRRHMPYCMGSLVWQLNDCWPVASWSTTDYYHNWKAAQYALREACKPVILAPQVTADSLKLWVVNDLPTPLAGTYTLEIKGFDGKLHQTRQGKYKIKANEAAPIAASSIAGLLQDNSHRETMAVITIRQGKKIVDRQNVYFALPKELLLRQPDIQIQISEEQGKKYLTATTDRLACDVMFYLPGVKAVFTDNYKDLLPGHPFRTEIRTTLSKEEIEQQIRCRWVGK